VSREENRGDAVKTAAQHTAGRAVKVRGLRSRTVIQLDLIVNYF